MRLSDSLDSSFLESLKLYGDQHIGLVYKIECLQNHRCYVGQTSGLWLQFVPEVRRFKEHRNALIKGTHKSRLLQADWNLYREDSFSVEIIETVPLNCFGHANCRSGYKSKVLIRERYWQLWLNAVYSHTGIKVFSAKAGFFC